MSASYRCNICGVKLSNHKSVFEDYTFADPQDKSDNIRLRIKLDFNNINDSSDICECCAKKKLRSYSRK